MDRGCCFRFKTCNVSLPTFALVFSMWDVTCCFAGGVLGRWATILVWMRLFWRSTVSPNADALRARKYMSAEGNRGRKNGGRFGFSLLRRLLFPLSSSLYPSVSPLQKPQLFPPPPSPSRVATPPAAPAPISEEEGENFETPEIEEGSVASSSDSDSFSWRDHWYPVSLIEDLDPRRPTPFQLLNREIVLWRDPNAGGWVAFDDRCPHRLAPLSEGRIDEDGCLQCSYHGWSFDGKGTCTKIPQASSEGPEARATQSSRACVAKLPTLVSQGLLFVWPDENGWEKASQTKPPMLPDDFNDPGFSTVTIQRDLFYGYDTLMENVSDPSHIDFAHHKVTGRRDRAKPLPFKLESSGAWGFAGANAGNPRISAKFVAPCYYLNKIEIDTKLPFLGDQKWVIWICSFNIPMAPGKTRSIVCSARNFFQFTMPGPEWWQLVPRWYEHWTSNKVYDGDMIVLQGQEKVFLSKSMEESADVNQQYTKLTFTPTQADRLVLAFRNWLRRYGNSQPDWFGFANQQSLPSTMLSKREMLDRFEQHTAKCSSCRDAYKTFQMLQKLFIASSVVLCASSGIPSAIQLRLLVAGAAVLSAAVAYALHEFQKNFVFVDYVHAEID
ncbi:pheophorbide a oxygenase, chloroplastic [Asparagus officinalis]|uniref:pheophorbide a oxygenase, chloroplastic n=1 Tax=Asparagus officinalis TaxID=4686 RepID=UPI00098E3F49|nr:pheophorbide a oxygenase, chloroplastic [Asparagus officinalis]